MYVEPLLEKSVKYVVEERVQCIKKQNTEYPKATFDCLWESH